MRGVCFEQVKRVGVHEVPDPVIENGRDAIVRVQLAGLCGSDLHPFFGREVGLDVGTVMGHEFVGEVAAVGDQVCEIEIGDRVLAPFTTNCGRCVFCESGLTSRCLQSELFGWRQRGEGLHGGQAEMVRVPFADSTLMPIPDGIGDETALLLGDNLSTGYFAADMVGIQPGGTYAVIGCGTVGLLAIASAYRLGAEQIFAVDPNEARLEIAASLGAVTFSDPTDAAREIQSQTGDSGADGVMEIVGLPEAQRLAFDVIRPGGTMSVIGCHCTPDFAFSPADLYDKNITYRTGRCPARSYMPRIAKLLAETPIDLSWCITHRFAMDQAAEAYDIFANGKQGCVKAAFAF